MSNRPTIRRADRIEDRLRLSVTIELKKCDEIKSQGCGKSLLLTGELGAWPTSQIGNCRVPLLLKAAPTKTRAAPHFTITMDALINPLRWTGCYEGATIAESHPPSKAIREPT
jgi:hypothetical protein